MDDSEWSNNHRANQEFPFTGTPRLSIELYDRTCCLSILKPFLINELTETIVDGTNRNIKLMN